VSAAGTYAEFVLLMLLQGAIKPLYRVGADAMIADLVPGEQRVDAYSMMRLCNNVGVAIGRLSADLSTGPPITWPSTWRLSASPFTACCWPCAPKRLCPLHPNTLRPRARGVGRLRAHLPRPALYDFYSGFVFAQL
jgi:MFS family permease